VNLNKDPESWMRVSPKCVMDGSEAQRINVLSMAIQDIWQMSQRIAKLETALRPFANLVDIGKHWLDEMPLARIDAFADSITVGDLRRASALLGPVTSTKRDTETLAKRRIT
jgi:hypothetical protein